MKTEIETPEQIRDRLLPEVLAYAKNEGLSEVGVAQAALRIGISRNRNDIARDLKKWVFETEAGPTISWNAVLHQLGFYTPESRKEFQESD